MEPNTAASKTFRGALGGISKLPIEPRLLFIKMAEGQASKWATGLYLITAPKLRGKSVATRGVAHAAATTGIRQVGVLYHFESGAEDYTLPTEGGEQKLIFREPSRYMTVDGIGELDTFIKNTGYEVLLSHPGLLVLDSISDPMRSFMPTERRNQGSAKEGMQPADQIFVKTLDKWAMQRNLVVLGVVNEDLVPFVSLLEGACQGMVIPISVSSFTKKDRATGRIDETYDLPEESVAAGIALMRYPALREKHTASRDFVTY
jgi:hypothetical protein